MPFARTWRVAERKYLKIARTGRVVERKFYKIAYNFRVNAANNRDNGRIYSLQNGNLCYIVSKIQLKINTMPQTENSKTRTRRAKTPAPNIETKLQCHIHDNAKELKIDEIGENLCGNLSTYKHIDKNFYCILHFPDKNKDRNEFSSAISSILRSVDNKIIEIEKLPEKKQQVEKDKLRYDFRYVWFPCNFSLRSKKVKVEANFAYATFCEIADFMKTEFLGYANFDSVSFHKIAYFIFAKFSANAYFFSAKFLAESDFKYTFFSNGKFTNAVFSESADFESSEIVRHANFINVNFLKKVNFRYAKLFIANFENAKFLSFANFESVEFLNSAYFKGNSDNLVFEKNATLDLQDAKIEKPERIIFHTIRLHPSWFVNIDSRKFVFTNIAWENHKARKSELKEELVALTRRGYKKPHNFQLLTIAFRNLAANAEEFNRFEEASNFRKSASECERLERLYHQKTWWNELKQQFHWKLLKKAPVDFVHFLYRYLSGYGEKWFRAFCWLFVIWFVFAVIYWLAQGFEGNKILGFGDSVGYSLQVMTLQRPEPRPEGLTRVIYGMETIFAPLQAALLALAIRRKFIR